MFIVRLMFEEQWYYDDSRKQKHFTIIQATSAIEFSMTTTVCNVFLQSPYKQRCVFIAFLFFGGFRGSVKPLEISFSTKKQLDAAPTGFPDPHTDLPPRTNPTYRANNSRRIRGKLENLVFEIFFW